MTSVITGDIINSRKLVNPRGWMVPLKKLLNGMGKSPKVWEIFRGDSFQLEIKRPEEALSTAILIKATIRSMKGMDVRIAMGIGKKNYAAPAISESNGEAFIYSGKKLDEAKKEKINLSLKTPWTDFDREMNLCLRLALIAMDSWSVGGSQLVKAALEHPGMGQQDISDILGITQPSVSERQKRAHFTEIMEMDALYREKIKTLLTHDIIP